MSNLYEILEVSEKASKEVIDKAYHVLAKKYHPDLQPELDKKSAESKMKQINEAYEILSNEEKRKKYDLELIQEREQQRRREQVEERTRENARNVQNREEQNIEKAREIQYQRNKQTQEQRNREKLQNEMNRAYAQAYHDYLRSLGYKIKQPWTWKRFVELLKVLGILAIIIAIIWFFPPTHKLLIEFYEGNIIVKTIVDIMGNILKGIGNAIVQFFQNTF